MSTRFLRAVAFMLMLLPLTVMATPRIQYTDILTGSNTGGENNQGAYLTLFGSGFGATQGASQVTINNVPVAAYKQWSDTKITVQPGANVTSGAIRVTVSGVSSETNNTFTVVPGKIFFVALNGSDTAGCGDFGGPCRTIQTTLNRSDFVPGSHLVIRGGTWSDMETTYGGFFSLAHMGGTAAAPIAVLGYPGETVLFFRTTQTRGFDTYQSTGYYTVANTHMDAQHVGIGYDAGVGTTNVRIVNNEIYNFFEDSGGAATIDGSGKGHRYLGNLIHDNGGSKLYHGIYFDSRDTTGPNDVEIAYNTIYNQTGGRGIQIYGDSGAIINNVRIHHNLIHHIHLDGIILSRDSGTGFQVYDNVVYHTADNMLQGPTADHGDGGNCLRFTGTTSGGGSSNLVAEVYNNTFVDCAVDGGAYSHSISFEQANHITLRNNIIDAPGVYVDSTFSVSAITSSNNMWLGGVTPASWDTNPVTGDVLSLFIGASVRNFHLLSGSAAIDRGSSSVNTVVTTDFDGNPRPQGGGYDIGAFESSGITLATPQNVRIAKK